MARSKTPQPLSGKSFSGILLEPIDAPDQLLVGLYCLNKPPDVQETIRNHVEAFIWAERVKRIIALVEHYEIDASRKSALLELLLRIAEDFIVGFTIGGHSIRPGRRKGSTKGDSFELFVQVESLKAKNHTTLGACTILSKKKGTEWTGISPAVLRARYDRHCHGMRDSEQRSRRHPLHSKLRALAYPKQPVGLDEN